MSKWYKAVLVAVLAMVVAGSLAGCGGTEEGTAAVAAPDYEIAKVEDLSMAGAVRTQYRVVVPGEVSEDELRAVIDEVIAKAKEEKDHNAISVGLFASADEVDGAYTLGVGELAPGGDWAAADTVKAGEYDKMELKVELY